MIRKYNRLSIRAKGFELIADPILQDPLNPNIRDKDFQTVKDTISSRFLNVLRAEEETKVVYKGVTYLVIRQKDSIFVREDGN